MFQAGFAPATPDGDTVRKVPADVIVLPSPLLGPAGYEPLVDALAARGAGAVVARLPDGALVPAAVLAAFVDQVTASAAPLLVAHSNAGYLVPAVRAAAPVESVVFVDAALPLAAAATTLLAPPQFGEFVAGLPQEDGLLPPWPLWWDPADVLPLFPSREWFTRVSDEAPRLPPSWFTTPVEVPSGWEALPAAYLGFGSTYAEELAFARAAGWPVEEVDGHHLHLLTDPAATAGAVLRLRERLG
ncbi:hypothetical protein GCM10025782_01560 [Pedococcus ginsenosidimutans]|uniref:AB hydrolase-1 domain-containing protein n=1 Tax=Pedococcus ginsenosidimutans TaxID=490570 RepID=A0ABP8XLF3_9MICO